MHTTRTGTRVAQGGLSFLLAALLCLSFADVTAVVAQETGRVTTPLLSASNDVDTPQANSTVRLLSSGICTGTLIAPRVVLTAGHCDYYGGYGGMKPNHWYDVRAEGRNIWAEFGPNSSSFRDRIQVTHINQSGNRDLVLLSLARAPDPSIAVPRSPLTSLPAAARANPEEFWARQRFMVAVCGGRDPDSHGGNLPTVRQVAPASSADLDCNVGWQDAICVRSGRSGQAQTRGGDSGGPLYWTNPEDNRSYLIGVLQGYGQQGDRYHYLWSDFQLGWHANFGDPPGHLIDLTQRDWIRQAIDRSFCGLMRRQVDRDARVRRLYLWWNADRGDNFTTANPNWAGCEGDRLSGYGFAGVQGSIFSPDHAQPRGTIPLYHWWSPGRGDNFITSDPRWRGTPGDRKDPDYRFVRIEGYLYPPDSGPRPGVVPLWSWWSGRRGDNFATTNPAWAPDSPGSHSPDYSYYRLEGYVMDPEPSTEAPF